MEEQLISALRARADTIRIRWEALLRIDRVESPLANPDTLTFLIPTTVDHIFSVLEKPARKPLSLGEARAIRPPECSCGCNPYRPFFKAGEQAMLEALILTQAEQPWLPNRERDLAEFYAAIRKLATHDIEAFCAICTQHGATHGCRFGAPQRKDACTLAHAT